MIKDYTLTFTTLKSCFIDKGRENLGLDLVCRGFTVVGIFSSKGGRVRDVFTAGVARVCAATAFTINVL